MTPMQYVKRLVLLALIIKVTSHPTPYGSRLINFWDSGIGSRRFVSDNNYNDDDRRHRQKNYGPTGSDSSRVEISFQPLRELESVSAASPFVAGKQFLAEDDSSRASAAPPPLPNLSAALSHNKRNFHRRRRTHHRTLEDNQRQRYPDEPLNEGPFSSSSSPAAVNALNEISYPEEDDADADGEVGSAVLPFDFMQRDLQTSRAASGGGNGEFSSDGEEVPSSSPSKDEEYSWNIFKRQQHPFSFGPIEGQYLYSSLVDDASNKRNALAAFKRQKFKSHQTQFIPSISVGAMTNLGDFFKNLKNNVEFMERGRFSGTEEQLLEGDHPISMLKEELSSDGIRPTGTAAFLHAIRTYRPSQRIRSLVALNPEGYHGSQFLDPNYMWVGLGKRK